MSQPRILFIGGTGRSGTNITKEILGKHSQVGALPFEYRFVVDPDGLVDFYKSYSASWSPFYADRRIRRLENLLRRMAHEPLARRLAGRAIQLWSSLTRIKYSPQQYPGWALSHHFPNYSSRVDSLINDLREFSFEAVWHGTPSFVRGPKLYFAGPRSETELTQPLGSFINDLVEAYLSHSQRSLFVEDNTWNILVAKELLELCPQAKLLHVYRDPRDVITSLVGQRWAPSELQQATRFYLTIIERWFAIKPTLPAGSLLEIKLEDLVQDPRRILSQVCSFAGVLFEEQLLSVDLSRSNSGRWKQELSLAQQTELQAQVASVLPRLGYS